VVLLPNRLLGAALAFPATQAGRKRHPLGVSHTRCRMNRLLSSARVALVSKALRVNQRIVLGGFICWCNSQLGMSYADRPRSDDLNGCVATTLQPRVVDHNPRQQVAALSASLASSYTAAAQVDSRRAADFAPVVQSAPISHSPIAAFRPAKPNFAPLNVEVSSLSPKHLQTTPRLEIHHGSSPAPGTSVALPARSAVGIDSHGSLSSLAPVFTTAGSMDSLGAGVSLERATAAPPALSPATAPAFGVVAPLGFAR
jgi:hypothetical protein